MTAKPTLVPVTQADRDAAHAFQNEMAARILNACRDASVASTLGDDEGDAAPIYQAFARHRLAAWNRRSQSPSLSGAWIDWQGGECPVASDAKVEVKFRTGLEDSDRACYWYWGQDGHDSDIVAYRLADKAPPSPSERLIEALEPILLFHEMGGHAGDGSDEALRRARTCIAEARGEK